MLELIDIEGFTNERSAEHLLAVGLIRIP